VHGHVSGQVVMGVELFAALRTHERFRRRFAVVVTASRLVVVVCRCRRCRHRGAGTRGAGMSLDRCGRRRGVSFYLE